MPYISSLGFERFRTFDQPATFDFAPLTIITGPNSSGKSSILKSLLLLRGSIRKEGFVGIEDYTGSGILRSLNFTGDEHGLRGIESIRTRWSDRASVRFSVGVEDALGTVLPSMMDRDATQREVAAFNAGITPQGDQEFTWPSPIIFDLSFRLQNARLFDIRIYDGSGPEEKLIGRITSPEAPIDYASYWDGTDNPLEVPIDTEYEVSGSWLIQHLGTDFESFCANLRVPRGKAAYEAYERLERPLIGRSDEGIAGLEALYTRLPSVLFDEASGDSDVSTFMRRLALYTVAPLFRTAVSSFLHAFSAIEHHRFSLISQDTTCVQLGSGLGMYLRGELSNVLDWSLQYWMNLFGMGDWLKVESIPGSHRLYNVAVMRDGQPFQFGELGSGHRQLLPFFLRLGVTADQQCPFLLEEPEVNLHPNLQARLADLFVSVTSETPQLPWSEYAMFTLSDKVEPVERPPDKAPFYLPTHQLIVETHSEYLIRRLQYLVASGHASSENVVIYYLGTDPRAKDYIRRIRITPNGQLSQPFGSGFTDEATNLMVDLYKQSSQN